MATRLSPLGKAIKWLVVPALCAAIGYYLVGPSVKGKLPASLQGKPETTETGTITAGNTPEVDPNKRTFAAPDVDVEVSKVAPTQKKKKKKRRRRSTVTQPSTTPSAPPSNDGGEATPPPPSDGGNG